MKKLLFIPILLFTIYSCSPDEETQAPTKYTLTVTADTEYDWDTFTKDRNYMFNKYLGK